MGSLPDLIAPARCLVCDRLGSALCSPCMSRMPAPTRADPVPDVDGVLARFVYAGVIRRLVLGLKLRALHSYAEPLVEGMVAVAREAGVIGDLITWVPGRRRDVIDRGFDHARVLAEGVGGHLGLPTAPLLRHSGTRRDQTVLGAQERWSNLRDAFAARPFQGRVVLVDDLVTTGATAHWAARALRAAGAGGVEVLVAARA